ncbi:MAG TPA: sulfatase-like hydrolase/transferase, partial [Candidatus Deferrimicrobium sp.]|nr:sulfatase-like hydrolase/transferase [Candidatus Deferrimicrobium sp.]
TPKEFSPIFSDYLQAQHYQDKALGEFIENLRQQGILDKSLLVIYGDHFGSGFVPQDFEKLLNLPQPLNEYTSKELNKVPLLIRLPGGTAAGVKHISGGQMDLLPTLINLLGLDKSKSLYFGQDLLNSKDGFSAFRFYSPDGTFATNEVFYLAAKDGVFEHGTAYDRKTGQKTDLERCRDGFRRATWQLNMSDLILETNGLPQLLPKIH